MDYNILEVDTDRRPPRLEIVKWLDHSSFKGGMWQSFETVVEDLTPLTIFSVGWVMRETKDYIVLSPTSDRQSTSASETCIVKPAIVKRWRLDDPSTPKKKARGTKR